MYIALILILIYTSRGAYPPIAEPCAVDKFAFDDSLRRVAPIAFSSSPSGTPMTSRADIHAREAQPLITGMAMARIENAAAGGPESEPARRRHDHAH
ncbi:hypothetical protein [Methylosinus sporium]|uniref:Uncharacterized protein n=1 Tax=Methylosinus sporium TaxID=428 RepID=A0A2U1SRS7_METSR|nr:hypothetical protein [Methylosinus sporium]PWB94316.1 hypothetical protein C5689_08310 [Methylosinus sporium]